jgi:hypothetical protein
MPQYEIVLTRTEYFSQTFRIEADSPEEAQEIAWDRSGNWKFIDVIDACEEVEGITEIKENENA